MEPLAVSSLQILRKDGVDDAPDGIAAPEWSVRRDAPVPGVTTIGLHIAKNVFHAHGSDSRGRGIFSKRLSPAKVLDFFRRATALHRGYGRPSGTHVGRRRVPHSVGVFNRLA